MSLKVRITSYNVCYTKLLRLVVLALVFAMVHRVWQAPKSVPVPFSTDVTVKEGVPTTIVFRYQLPEPATDSFSIQLSWNPLERTPIQSDRNFLTATYYYPGLHRSKLLCNGMIACQRNVYITAPDWVVLYRYTPTDVLPHYIPLQEVLGEGCLSVTPDILVAQGAQIDNEVYTSFIYSNSKLETDADAMYLEASFRNIPLNYA